MIVKPLSAEAATEAARSVELPEAFAQLNVFRVLLHHPQIAKSVGDLLVNQLFRGTMDGRLRELIIMRLGWATGSEYEWTQHWRVAQDQFGVSELDLLAVRDWQKSDRFGPAERAVLTATDETLAHGRISRDTLERCREAAGDAGLLEITMAIGTWRMISQVLRSLEIDLEEGVAGWPPDGTPSPEAVHGS